MFSIKDLFEAIVGGGEPQGLKASAKGAGMGAMASRQTPSQRDYPGRTDYGTPQDNMIDQMGGYVTRQQYDKNFMNNGFLRNAKYEDEGFTGSPSNLNQFSPQNADVKNFNQQSQQIQQVNPMDFTGGSGFNPRYNQEPLPQVQGGMPTAGRNRLRVR